MASESEYLVRDLYDIVVAHVLAPEELSLAISHLDESEIGSVRNDINRGIFAISDFDKLIDPRSSTLAESKEVLETISSQILIGNLSSETSELLDEIKHTELEVGNQSRES